jgi:hypothetical protein
MEFAKRLFGPEGEYTGIPVDILFGIHQYPEQVLELVRLLRTRGYSDDVLMTGMSSFLTKMSRKTSEQVCYVLSAPESVSGAPPLMEGDTWNFSQGSIENALQFARQNVFNGKVMDLLEKHEITHSSSTDMVQDHPVIVAIGEKVMEYIYQTERSGDEYSIYNS